MDKKYFLHRNNIITGPFDRAVLLAMLKNGTISLLDMLSTDKKHPQKLAAVLDIIVPEIEAPAADKTQETPVAAATGHAPEPAACINAAASAPTPAASSVRQPVQPQPVKLTMFETLSRTVDALFNTEGTQQKLLLAGSEVMTTSAIFAIFISLMLCASGVLFYGRYYQTAFHIILASGMIWTVLSGIFSFLYCRLIKVCSQKSAFLPPEADFMFSTHCMMFAGMLFLICNAVMFLLNRQLFALNFRQLATAFAIGLLPGICFLGNLFLTIRANLMQNKSLNKDAAAAWAALAIWLLIIIFFFIQYAVYKI